MPPTPSRSGYPAGREDLIGFLSHLADTGVIALALLDVDGMRELNEAAGIEAGDTILTTLLDRLQSSCRERDFVSRIGDDEFVVVSTGLRDHDDAQAWANRISWISNRAYSIDGHQIAAHLSIGWAASASVGDGVVDLLADASTALHAAKSSGGAQAIEFSTELRENSRRRFHIQTDLRQAITQHSFLLHYQAQIRLSDMSVCGAEALLRWHHRERGWIPPGTFVPVAEESGLIVPIGHWVLRSAAAQLARWLSTGHELDMSVNVTADQMSQPDLVFQVGEVLTSTGVPANRLTLELTESQLLRNIEISRPMMHSLRELGVRISIDDFGTGYSSLNQLKRVPADELKVDMSLIQDLPGDHRDRAIVRAAIDMAHALDLTVVAEGVETQAQMDCLRELGCDIVQGYLTARPTPAQQLDFRPRTLPLADARSDLSAGT